MTTEHPTAPRLLRRRSDDRVIGGVASGLGDFLNIDPLLIRIGFVGLMVFGGLGLLLYVGAWLLVPDDTTDQSILEQLIRGTGPTRNPWLRVTLLVVGVLVVAGVLSNVFWSVGSVADRGDFGGESSFFGILTVALLIVLIGALVMRRNDPIDVASSVDAAAPTATAPEAASVASAPAMPRPRRERRPASPLGWYVLGAVLVAIGVLALLTNLTDVTVELAQYFGLALAVLGVGLVVGTWWGRARMLILLGILLLPIALMASYVSAPLEGGIGDQRYTPMDPAELQDQYRLTGGQLVLDLTQVDLTEPIEVTASVALGELVVFLPEEVAGEVDATVGAGSYYILGASQSGTELENRSVLDGTGPDVTMTLDAGIGSIRVLREGSQGR